jgi:hypothetical protein
METSPEIKNIAKALKEFQASAPNISKDADANYGRYATLGNVIETTRADLAANGLSFSQIPDGDGLTTIIMHETGEWIRATARMMLDKQTPQGQGSAITYMRRYALSAALGIATEDDDDGNVANRTNHEREKAPQSRQTAGSTTKANDAKKDPATELKAAKDRLISLLKLLGCTELKTKKQYEDAVFYLTGYILADKDIDAINEKLAALVEKQDDNK